MAFTLPTFNLSVNIWRGPVTVFPPPGGPALTVLCNLTPGRRVILEAGTTGIPTFILLPALTDIRSARSGVADAVEVPAGTGRYYTVLWVDDVAKGFENEHRIAALTQSGVWPTPIP